MFLHELAIMEDVSVNFETSDPITNKVASLANAMTYKPGLMAYDKSKA